MYANTSYRCKTLWFFKLTILFMSPRSFELLPTPFRKIEEHSSLQLMATDSLWSTSSMKKYVFWVTYYMH